MSKAKDDTTGSPPVLEAQKDLLTGNLKTPTKVSPKPLFGYSRLEKFWAPTPEMRLHSMKPPGMRKTLRGSHEPTRPQSKEISPDAKNAKRKGHTKFRSPHPKCGEETLRDVVRSHLRAKGHGLHENNDYKSRKMKLQDAQHGFSTQRKTNIDPKLKIQKNGNRSRTWRWSHLSHDKEGQKLQQCTDKRAMTSLGELMRPSLSKLKHSFSC